VANGSRRSALPTTSTELYLSGGFGFHSNDARGTTITVNPATGEPASRVDPLVRSRGAETGLRTSLLNGLRTTVSAWTLDLDSELLFVGDAGLTEPSSASRRRGITFANFYRPTRLLAIDADVSFARARFTGTPASESHIPGALENVVDSLSVRARRGSRRRFAFGTSARIHSLKTTPRAPAHRIS